eukprot:TRINITY_DN10778_c0_g1_i1.p1 TRINITY_DN10778_c0_g1~~TRINITY_DN10778_c0_g1_i1.p1  ORF type:complete len:386 (-),score=40.72 TRINITY_DN10778_c0_g1_i1:180-1337(-)
MAHVPKVQSGLARARASGAPRVARSRRFLTSQCGDTRFQRGIGLSCRSAADVASLADADQPVIDVSSVEELERYLHVARNRLVVLEVMSDAVCETGLIEVDDGWDLEKDKKERAKLEVCQHIRHDFVRMAAKSPNVTFLSTLVDPSEPSELAKHLHVQHYPTALFFKNGEVVWKSEGSHAMKGDMAEGVLYFGNPTKNVKGSEHMQELYSEDDLNRFLAGETGGNSDLKIVMLSTHMCSPCIHVYPSTLMLAMNFEGAIDFAKLEDDGSEELEDLFYSLNILEVPTFLIYFKGREVSRNVSSSRGDLIGHILQVASQYGIAPPKSPRKQLARRDRKLLRPLHLSRHPVCCHVHWLRATILAAKATLFKLAVLCMLTNPAGLQSTA